MSSSMNLPRSLSVALCLCLLSIAPRAFAQEGAVHNADRATGTTAAGVAHETARAGESAAAEREATAPLLPSNATEAKEYGLIDSIVESGSVVPNCS